MFIENCQETSINNLYKDNIENKHGGNMEKSSNITAKWRKYTPLRNNKLALRKLGYEAQETNSFIGSDQNYYTRTGP